MASTIETLERELGEAQRERETQQRAVMRAEKAHDAVCAARDDAWEEATGADEEVERLSALVFERRRELYEAIDGLKTAEGKERRIKSRLMYVLPAERRRYLSGAVDEEFDGFVAAVREAYDDVPGLAVSVVTENPGEFDLRGDATWRALERLYSGTSRRWVEVHAGEGSPQLGDMARQIAHYAGGHVPRVFAGEVELRIEDVSTSAAGEAGGYRELRGFEGSAGRLSLARITSHRYLDESTVGRLQKHPEALVRIAEIARLYQTMNLTGDEIRWRLEQLISLRLEQLEVVYRLTGERRRFSFYEIARTARLLDSHFPDAGVAAEALLGAVDQALETGVPLVDVAYLSVTSPGDRF
ncbi:MAG: hypothetical protein H0V53_00800 [Rubrobacter sp.]|nr:hypothetical protein [Rubrobacter sp.]